MNNCANHPSTPANPWTSFLQRTSATTSMHQHGQQREQHQTMSIYSNFPSTSGQTTSNDVTYSALYADRRQFPPLRNRSFIWTHTDGFKKSLEVPPPSTNYTPVQPPIVRCNHCPLPANRRCLECVEFFCPRCVLSHTRSNPHATHNVVPFESAAVIKPIGSRSTTSSISESSNVSKSPSPTPENCLTHNEAIRSFCVNCCLDVCQECTLLQHAEHKIITIDECISFSHDALKKLLVIAENGTASVKSNIDKATKMPSIIDRHNIDTVNKIKRAMKRMHAAVEEREANLLGIIDRMRLSKISETDTKTEHLRRILASLSVITNKINKAFHRGGRMESVKAGKELEEEMNGLLNYYQQNKILEERIEFEYVNDYGFKEMIKNHGFLNFNIIEPNHIVPPRLFHNYYNNVMLTPQPNSPCKIAQCIPGSLAPVYMRKPENFQRPNMRFALTGQENGQLSRPWGLCIDKKGNFLVADRRNNRIQIFTPDGQFKLTFGEKGKGDGEFELPAGICINNQNEIIVVDKDNHRIQVFEETGKFLFKFGSCGTGTGQFSYPWDVDVNDLGDMIVTDTRNHRLQMFNARGNVLKVLNLDHFNYFKTIKGVTSPRGCCFIRNGNIAVTDFENSRVLIVDKNLSGILQTRGYEGCDDTAFCRPSGIVSDDAGCIIIADGKNQRVQAFSPFFEFQWSVNVPILSDKDRPCDVALTPEGRLAVLMENVPNANCTDRISGFYNLYVY